MKHSHVALSIVALAATAMLLVTRPWDDSAVPPGGQGDALVSANPEPGAPAAQAAAYETIIRTDSIDPMRVAGAETVWRNHESAPIRSRLLNRRQPAVLIGSYRQRGMTGSVRLVRNVRSP